MDKNVDLTKAYNAASLLKPALEELHNAPGSTFGYSIAPYGGELNIYTNIIVDVAAEDDSDTYAPTLNIHISKDGAMYAVGDTAPAPYSGDDRIHVDAGQDVKRMTDFIASYAHRKGLVP